MSNEVNLINEIRPNYHLHHVADNPLFLVKWNVSSPGIIHGN